jgi:hypothetical protein
LISNGGRVVVSRKGSWIHGVFQSGEHGKENVVSVT